MELVMDSHLMDVASLSVVLQMQSHSSKIIEIGKLHATMLVVVTEICD
jgi:hypothetical protein